MLIWFFGLCLAAGITGVLSLLAGRRLAGRASEPGPPDYDWLTAAENRLTRFYWRFADFFVHFGWHLYFYTLVVLRQLVTAAKFILWLIEKRFSRMIDSVRGQGINNAKRGTVSLFLAEIKNHQDKVRRRPSNKSPP